ncbi:ABC transporter permease [Paenibacillus sp. CC-CFT747]|nr:ABC transporter permease [Paenibacillus sp. CC-CFT747]
MVSLYPLVKNETIKMLKKRRFLVVLLIILILIPIFTYAQMKVAENTRKQLGTTDWRVSVNKRITDLTNGLSNNIPEDWKKWRRVEIQRLQYSLDKNVDPSSPNGVTFTRDFLKNSISLFLPLLVAVVASDLVSSEQSTGTMKLLLTRPVRRWKILMSKLVSLLLFVSLILLSTGVLSYLISGLVFGYGGWDMPVLTGYQVTGDELSTEKVHVVPQWLYLIMEFGLAWFSCTVVACLTLMVSVLVRSTAAGMGIMLATLIAGTILTNMVSSWESAKYLFMINLDLVSYMNATLPPVPGLNLAFSLTVLSIWGLAGLAIAFRVFTKRDMLG